MKRELTFGAHRLCYELTRKRVKYINARVDRMGNLLVSAPPFVPVARVDALLLENAEGLLAAIQKRKTILQEAPVFKEGATVSVFGEKKVIHIVWKGARGVTDTGATLIVKIGKNEDERDASRLFSSYLKKLAEKTLTRLYDEGYERYFSDLFPKPILRFRRMRSSWGNCRCEGIVTLNLRLVYLPIPVIEYVIVHELVHMLHPNHSPRFWSTVGKYMGDYKARRALLSGFSIALDSFL